MPGEDDSPDRLADLPTFLFEMSVAKRKPQKLLAGLVKVLHSTPEPDPELCLEVGSGSLEALLAKHERKLWPEIEGLARTDVRFRRALSAVWAYDSPEYKRRTALLAELGESRRIKVSFTVEPDDFSSDPPLSWRAFDSKGTISNQRLAEVLRRIADWLDRQDDSTE